MAGTQSLDDLLKNYTPDQHVIVCVPVYWKARTCDSQQKGPRKSMHVLAAYILWC